jgi:putative transposase
MEQNRFIEEQIIGILRAQKSCMTVADLCRKHAIGKAEVSKEKTRLGGMDVSDTRGLDQLEEENSKLKMLLAASTLDNLILKKSIRKMLAPTRKREEVSHLVINRE